MVGREEDRRAAPDLDISVGSGNLTTGRDGQWAAAGRESEPLVEIKAKTAKIPGALGIVGLKLGAPSLGVDQRSNSTLNRRR